MAVNRYDYCIGTANPGLKKSLALMLGTAGFYSSGEGKSIPLLLRTLRSVQPWLAVIDTDLPPGNVEELAAIIENDGLAAALYINSGSTRLRNHVQLSWPVDAMVLTAVAEAICNEFAHKKKLQSKIEALQQKLYERKIIEKAKGIVTIKFTLSEEESYQFLQRMSMKKRISIAALASQVIADPDLLSAL